MTHAFANSPIAYGQVLVASVQIGVAWNVCSGVYMTNASIECTIRFTTGVGRVTVQVLLLTVIFVTIISSSSMMILVGKTVGHKTKGAWPVVPTVIFESPIATDASSFP